MRLTVSSQFLVSGTHNLDAQTDDIMETLLNLEAASAGTVTDTDLTVSLTQRTITVSVTIESDTTDNAERTGIEIIETAITNTTRPNRLGDRVPQFAPHLPHLTEGQPAFHCS